MASTLCLCLLNIIQMYAAFEFHSYVPSPVSSLSLSGTNNQIKNVVSDVTKQESRLKKMEELARKQEELLGKQGELLSQLNESLKDQSKLSLAQNQKISKMQASQLEQKSHLAAIEGQLHQLDGRLVVFENVSSDRDSMKTDDTVSIVESVHNKKPKVNFTTIQNVGLSFALVMERVSYSKMEEYCAQLVDSGRMIVLDSKAKMEALKTHLATISASLEMPSKESSKRILICIQQKMRHDLFVTHEKKGNFYVGLRKRKRDGKHVWSNGRAIDHTFWCYSHSVHKHNCGAIKLRNSCIGAVECTKGRFICEKPL